MRRAGILRALLLSAVAAAAIAPLFSVDWFDSHEAASYPARLVEVGRCWDDGMLSARWFPDLAGGCGYPFLSFYAPLSFWAAGVVRALGAGPALAWKLVVAAATLAGAAGAYRLAREGLGAAGSFAAAALWVWAPYHLRDLWVRGDLAEYAALGLLPWALRATLRLRWKPDAGQAAACALLGAATILTHNVVGLFTGLAMAACAVPVLAFREGEPAGRVARALAGAGAAALLLGAFFWVPALAERSWVQLENLQRGIFDVGTNFVRLRDLLQLTPPPRVHVPGRAEPMAFELGIALVPAVLTPLALRRASRAGRALLLLAAMLFVGGALLTLRAAAPVYEAVPLLRFVGFPWRFLSLASLGLALLAGAGIEGVAGRTGPAAAVVSALVAAAAIAVSWPTAKPSAALDLEPWMLDPAAYREAGFTGSVANEYLPRWVRGRENIPFRDGLAVEGSARLEDIERGVARWSFTVEAPDTVTVVLQDFYYPGWKGTLDGEPLAIEPREPSGHAELRCPPGRHRIEARLEPAPVRRASAWISALAAAAGLLVLRRARRRARGKERDA